MGFSTEEGIVAPCFDPTLDGPHRPIRQRAAFHCVGMDPNMRLPDQMIHKRIQVPLLVEIRLLIGLPKQPLPLRCGSWRLLRERDRSQPLGQAPEQGFAAQGFCETRIIDLASHIHTDHEETMLVRRNLEP